MRDDFLWSPGCMDMGLEDEEEFHSDLPEVSLPEKFITISKGLINFIVTNNMQKV